MHSSWAQLPQDALQMLTALLVRDDVASVAKVWPEASQDKVLKVLMPGGTPICSACSKRVVENSLAGLLRYDPTATLDKLREYDDLATYQIEIDLATLFVRGVMNKGCNRQPTSRTCYLCNNKQEFEHHLVSQEWQALSARYAKSLATGLKDSYITHLDSHHQVYWTYVVPKLLPLVCSRCGIFGCDGSSRCEWYCGEDAVVQQMQQQLVEQRMVLLQARGPCGCRCKKKEPDNVYNWCACTYCNNTAGGLCNFCRKCCRAVHCPHNGGLLQPQIYPCFLKYIYVDDY